MKNLRLPILLIAGLFTSIAAFAGNDDRAGEAGASQLLINPWTKSVGFGGANTAFATGLEAMNLNIAGLAFTRKTEIMFTHKQWLVGSEVNINSFGLAQRVGETSVFGVSIMSMGFGDIDITQVNLPEGGIGTFSPSYMNIELGFAKEFSNSISGGLSVKSISESIADVSASGVAFNAGVKYITGEHQQIKFGISLMNVGAPMQYSGDGLSFMNTDVNTSVNATQEHRSNTFELPSLLNIGGSYDFYFAATVDSVSNEMKSLHRLTVAGNFTSNAFTKDQFRLGLEYSFKSMFQVRGGYVLENETWFDSELRTSAYTGPAFGASFIAPLSKKGTTFSIDYAYQFTENFAGTHSIGIKLDL